MKRFREAKHPVNFWTSRSLVGIAILSMALIFIGLHSVPRLETRKPRSWPAGTPNTHFSGLSLIWNRRRFSNVSLRSSNKVSRFSVFTTMSST